MEYNSGFHGSDCVLKNGASAFVSGRNGTSKSQVVTIQSRNGFANSEVHPVNGTSKSKDSVPFNGTSKCMTQVNGTAKPLVLGQNGNSNNKCNQVVKPNGFSLNGYALGHGTAKESGKPIIPPKNGIFNKSAPTRKRKPANSTPQLSYYKDQHGLPKVRKGPPVTEVRESFEKCSLIDALYTYLCYTFLVLVGYANDLLRPIASAEKYRKGYVPLYASFESFYTRHIYRRVRNLWSIPVASVPGDKITLLERITNDNGWTFEVTDKKNECINLGSYNYLGFAENVGACAEAALQSTKYGVARASTRMELGHSPYHDELEKLVARFMGVEASVTCGMGFATNSLNIPAILSKGCLVISDEKNHASIILGLRLSGATIRVFKHNNMKSLERKLREGIVSGQPRTHLPWKKVFIVVEGVYSMEGSICRLPEIVALKKKYGAYIYLDEAHSVGAIGEHGRGAVDYYGLNPTDVDILMGTFTKSFGSAGGYIAGSRAFIEQLKRNSHAHYYGTAMTPAVAAQIITSMKIIMGEDGTEDGVNRVAKLKRNSRYFRQKLMQKGFIVYGNEDSPVVPVALYYPSKITYVIAELVRRGVATVGVGFPATPLVEGRVRFCVSAAHTKEMLDKSLDLMDEIGDSICAKSSRLPRRQDEIQYEDESEDESVNEVD